MTAVSVASKLASHIRFHLCCMLSAVILIFLQITWHEGQTCLDYNESGIQINKLRSSNMHSALKTSPPSV
jgi:hypothetical protein